MAHATTPIINRILWCRRQGTLAREQPERDFWRAEEEGLRDALFQQDHMKQYQSSSPEVFKRYAMGLNDGKAIIRVARVLMQRNPPAVSESRTLVETL
jgi:hypothetical protein